jgi:hypothetical protein
MNTSFTNKQIRLSAACALTLSFAFPAQATDLRPGASIWRNVNAEVGAGPAGEWCWNREFNSVTPPSGCGQEQPVAQYVAPAPAPALAAPATAPAAVQAQYVAPVRTQPAPVAVLSERPAKQDRN